MAVEMFESGEVDEGILRNREDMLANTNVDVVNTEEYEDIFTLEDELAADQVATDEMRGANTITRVKKLNLCWNS